MPFDEIETGLQKEIRPWTEKYLSVHAVAHWDDAQRKREGNYQTRLDEAAEQAEELLAVAGRQVVPLLLESYPAVVWEDQDDCLEVRPEDVLL